MTVGVDGREAELPQFLSIREVRNRTERALTEVLAHDYKAVVTTPPNGGKSHGAVKAIARTGTPALFCSQRRELYEVIREWCEQDRLTHKTLPSLPSDCETYPDDDDGEPSTREEKQVKKLYDRGMSPSEIHKNEICPAGKSCEYEQQKPSIKGDDQMGHVPKEEAHVLIGHPKQAHVPQYVNNRTLVFDDINTETFIEPHEPTSQNLNAILSHDEFPINSVSGLIDVKGEDNQETMKILDESDFDIWDDDSTITDAGKIVRTFLAAEQLGNEFYDYHHRTMDDEESFDAVIDKGDTVHILQPPKFLYLSNNVIVLDGTPLRDGDNPFWYAHQFSKFDQIVDVVDEEEKREYYDDVMGLTVIQTTPHLRPGMGRRTARLTDVDRERLQKIVRRFGSPDGTITSKKAIPYLEDLNLDFADIKNYASICSSNDFSQKELGFILKSPNYGHHHIYKIAGLMGEGVTTNDLNGKEKEFTGVGQYIHKYIEQNVEQAIARFGRDEDVEPTVICETAAIPEYMPIEEHFISRTTCRDRVLWYLKAVGSFREATGEDGRIMATEIYEAVDYDDSAVRKELYKLEDEGIVEKSTLPERGGPTAWKPCEL